MSGGILTACDACPRIGYRSYLSGNSGFAAVNGAQPQPASVTLLKLELD